VLATLVSLIHPAATALSSIAVAAGFWFAKRWIAYVDTRFESIGKVEQKLSESDQDIAVLRTEFEDSRKALTSSLEDTKEVLRRIEERVDRVLELQLNGHGRSKEPRANKKGHSRKH